VKIHLLYVVRGTALHRLYIQGRYRCLEQEVYVDLAARFVRILPREVIIQRLTGDPHREELVAPKWALNKQQTLQMIEGRMRDQTSDVRGQWSGRGRGEKSEKGREKGQD
ncbi:MAG: hypothetical protein ACOC0T_02155, partial [Desulfovermiculus sp.]